MNSNINTVGIDIGSTTVKIAILDPDKNILFSDYRRHFANIQQTLCDILSDAIDILGDLNLGAVITGSGGLAISSHLDVQFVQEVVLLLFYQHDCCQETWLKSLDWFLLRYNYN